MIVKTGLGQDSHRFDKQANKKLILGGVPIQDAPALQGNSDADVVLHAITNALSSISGTPILGAIADELCLQQKITDSKVYLQKALELLPDYRITNIAISIECKVPKLLPHLITIRESIAKILSISIEDVGITATSGEGLTEFGKGEGIQAFAIITVCKES